MTRATNAALAAIAIVATATNASAQSGGGSLPNGRPFQILQSQITTLEAQIASIEQQLLSLASMQHQLDALAAQVAANTASIEELREYDRLQDQQIAALGGAVLALQAFMTGVEADLAALRLHGEVVDQWLAALDQQWRDAEARLAANAADIQALVDADRALQEYAAALQLQIDFALATATGAESMVLDAQVRLDELEAQLALKQNLIQSACAPGWSIRQISSTGQVTCEFDDSGTGGGVLKTADTWSTVVTVPANSVGYAFAYCPSGYLPLGGGFSAPLSLRVIYDAPVVDFGWVIGAANTTSLAVGFSAVVRCAAVQ